MTGDLTFITNQQGRTLKNRFATLIRDTRFFDVLVGYFYTSGFHALYKSLEKTERIRILIGINTNRETVDLVRQSQATTQQSLPLSHAEVKETLSAAVVDEMAASSDDAQTEEGTRKFVEWLRSEKMTIRAYPSERIHAKLYIMTFAEGDRDAGRVITGSSNFTQAGLVDNLEFNVELKGRADYDFALAKFNELWADAVDLTDKYLETIQTKTWLNNAISPHELYLKFLYEYFREKINIDQETRDRRYLPERFLDLEYQSEAVTDARAKLDEYGGVFLSDVVGLGKTYVSAMLAQQLEGPNIVIAPPSLLDEHNPASWPNVFRDFQIAQPRYVSSGKIEHLSHEDTARYKNIFIDEAHRFRTETTDTYEKLARICRGKRIILVTATPLNNTPRDILGQLKLFQKAKKSTIPNLPNLEAFFKRLEKNLDGLDRLRDREEYMRIVRENAREIREKVLKYVMVRRTRTEINRYYGADLASQKLRFPAVADPEPVFYEFNEEENRVFTGTIANVTRKMTYARYMPMIHYKRRIDQLQRQSQINMAKFMKILLVKRLESSFHAFRLTLERFIKSYKLFIAEFDRGNVYVSSKHTGKIFELLENDDDESIQQLIDEEKAERYDAADFEEEFRDNLESDLGVLREIEKQWQTIRRDPKLAKFTDILKNKPILKKAKLIVFTESRETAEYLHGNIDKIFPDQTLLYTGDSGAPTRDRVIDNFDANVRLPKDDCRILIATEVLAEGVNLHRSNIVINYDLPWNPTRMIQRVGRINRVDTKFDTIHTFNFFPTVQSNEEIKLKEAAEAKIEAFIEMLGNDARLLTEGEEIKSHDLFAKLTSKKSITGEDESEESELKYLQIIRDIRDDDPELFDHIKRLPKKARSARGGESRSSSLLTYFRKGKVQKFYRTDSVATRELDFLETAGMLETPPDTPRAALGKELYEYLERNKDAFLEATSGELPEETARQGGRDSAAQIMRILKSKQIRLFQGFTEEDEQYIKDVLRILDEGAIPDQTRRKLLKALKEETNPLRILGILKTTIAPEFFKATAAEGAAQTAGPREVILSEYFAGE